MNMAVDRIPVSEWAQLARLLKADISRPITLRCDECLERRSYSPPHDDPTGGIAGPCSRSGEKRFQTNRSASPR
ncbi:uncharacterized protein LAJ45_04766 [Morchella importuna]|uniref:uncharacterized protein n=1 Tax=Morchella importuna TaxID=1174673 RepID=UPI001E8E2343|nr:uncharacterized protein LAJ45_04766 [Morchella importuna]KAH8151064.1 hypothetical protein LAJ45_04766 [Morchella importuna]